MPWLELSFEADKSSSAALEEALTELGALAVTIQDLEDEPIFEPAIGTAPYWERNKVTGLFENETDLEALLPLISKRLDKRPLPPHKIEPLEDREWEREWLIHFKPLIFGQRLVICPTTEKLDTNTLPENPVIIQMDPGLAFGTGTHETTDLCLQWLDENPLEDKTLIDFGCGSGILAIAAKMLGCSHVWATDIDSQAISASQNNAKNNQITSGMDILNLEQFEQQKPASGTDIVIANILAGPLQKLAKELSNMVKSGGIIVLSGILDTQAELVRSSYEASFCDIEITQKNDWIRLTGRKR